ncbi:YdaS family helix-turn-helix protein [Caballeronia sp. LZ043]|uniref:transcriptional regulator n=1 Tax=Caballeronia sp. LZ043 TaxID=3038569 RepID=UPI00285D3453|nr:YdaS family helix-turn-helix protein [Caballeronia sp. LZ043]MDR5824737.1 YdaS family helix-turn-helix protein [Caballeronia sp. LZ043]
MDKLRTFLNSMTPEKQEEFARACGTSLGYLRKAISADQRFDVQLCINIEEQSQGAVRCEDLRPQVTWSKLRGTAEAA